MATGSASDTGVSSYAGGSSADAVPDTCMHLRRIGRPLNVLGNSNLIWYTK